MSEGGSYRLGTTTEVRLHTTSGSLAGFCGDRRPVVGDKTFDWKL
jgi:hypothetical protein